MDSHMSLVQQKQFLEERLKREESILFIAIENGDQKGFTQLYPSFSSVSMTKIWILNDLFVSAERRRTGIAQALINHVIAYCKLSRRRKLCCLPLMIISMHKNCMKNLALPGKISTITNYGSI
jgi:GNAT superfamily N-acetyltransferase